MLKPAQRNTNIPEKKSNSSNYGIDNRQSHIRQLVLQRNGGSDDDDSGWVDYFDEKYGTYQENNEGKYRIFLNEHIGYVEGEWQEEGDFILFNGSDSQSYYYDLKSKSWEPLDFDENESTSDDEEKPDNDITDLPEDIADKILAGFKKHTEAPASAGAEKAKEEAAEPEWKDWDELTKTHSREIDKGKSKSTNYYKAAIDMISYLDKWKVGYKIEDQVVDTSGWIGIQQDLASILALPLDSEKKPGDTNTYISPEQKKKLIEYKRWVDSLFSKTATKSQHHIERIEANIAKKKQLEEEAKKKKLML